MIYNKHKKGYRITAWMLFGMYVLLMIYFLFFAESMGRVASTREYHYNLHPFREIHRFLVYYEILGIDAVCMNLLGNIVAFVPFGLFLPFLSRKSRSFCKVSLLSFEVSLFVEIIQLVTRVGSCDVDDVILNTLGGMIGYLCFKIIFAWHKKGMKEVANEAKITY